jgi:DNA-binding GntR family transcriptional regulator
MKATFPEIAPQSLSERVASALKDAFFSGELKPGDAIVEREIARQMKVGTPVVREALISLQGQGFVRRVVNTGTYVSQFTNDEIRQLYSLRVELELMALRWAREHVSKADLQELRREVAEVVQAGERGNRREFLERDYAFHRHCWKLSGNSYLVETMERLMAPLFAFAVVASGTPLTADMGREHYELIHALEDLEEPEFTQVARKTLAGFAGRWLTKLNVDEKPVSAENAETKSNSRRSWPR